MLLLVTAAAPSLGAQNATLRGVVHDSATSAPLSGARIELRTTQATWSATTDEQGRYQFAGLSPGRLAIRATRIGYAPRNTELAVVAGEQRIDLALPALGVPLDPIVVSASRQGSSAFDVPAAVTVIGRAQVADQPALTPIEQVRTTPGMDMAAKGLVQRTYAVRGERGSISGALLTLTDFRSSDLPSFSLNVPYLLATTEDDIERIEVVRGPGSALYGPGADRGVVQIVTRSPFESRGGTATLTTGTRGLFGASLRWAGVPHPRVAIKLSADYLEGRDWAYSDSTENAKRDTALAGGADPDTLRIARRDPWLARVGGEARLDWRPAAETEVIATAGIANALHVVDLGGDLGSIQGRDWMYRYLQARVRRGRLSGNLFYNHSNTGDSYQLRTGARLVDSSRVLVGQLQHGMGLGRLDLLYGADVRWTDPRTGGTINGANEANDRMLETGAWLHGTLPAGPRVQIVAALRLDHHSRLDDVVLSPRAAVVFRPAARHALRLSVNRAFTSPDANTLFSDTDVGGQAPFTVRAGSVPQGGYSFDRSCGGPCFQSPFAPGVLLPLDATLAWPGIVQYAALNGFDLSGVPAPTAADIVTRLVALDLDGSFVPTSTAAVQDIPALRRTMTTAVEFGWRVAPSPRSSVSVDLHVSRVNDVRGTRYAATPNALFDLVQLSAWLHAYLPPGTADSATTLLAATPVGTVSPREAPHPTDIMMLSRQGGEYTLVGVDVAFELPLGRLVTARGNASWLSHDSVSVSSSAAYVLGVPRYKGSLGLALHPTPGYSAGVEGRLVSSFPVNSGAYEGRVNSYGVLDFRVSVPVIANRISLSADVSNVLDNVHQEFVDAPAIGRMMTLRVRSAF